MLTLVLATLLLLLITVHSLASTLTLQGFLCSKMWEDIEFKDMYGDDALQLDMVTFGAITVLQSDLDFSKESIPTKIILMVINSITSQAITPAEQVRGKFTCHKLKNMDTWNDWELGERKQLN